LRTLSAKVERDQAVALLAAILSAPRFDAGIWSARRHGSSPVSKKRRTQPEYIGAKAFQGAIYGDHPYALNERGEVETVAKLTRDDLVAFHRTYCRARNMSIAMMGDISRADAQALAEKHWRAACRPGAAPPIAPVRVAEQGRQQVFPTPPRKAICSWACPA